MTETEGAIQAAAPFEDNDGIFEIAERLQAPMRPAEAVMLAQTIVDFVAERALPRELDDETGEIGWKSRWKDLGPNRWTALREHLRLQSPRLFGGL